MKTPTTADMYWTLVASDSPIDGEGDSNPRADFQLETISLCRALRPQQLSTAIRYTEIKGSLMVQ
jgi:hypothetical protein